MKQLLLALALAVAAAPPAAALRPFDTTDAAVAGRGELEFEFGYLDLLREGRQRSLVAPALVVNAGVASSSELVVEGRLRTGIGGHSESQGTAVEDAAVSLKHVFRAGVLQGKGGASVASECGLLLPTGSGERAGLTCAGIVSHRISNAVVHLNAVFERNREREWEKTLGLIIAGPRQGDVQPVFEALVGTVSGGPTTRSALAGLIVTVADNLTFDVALRAARVGGTSVSEVRAGLTWSPR